MVEQRPFKALVVGSSPTQPNAILSVAFVYILRGSTGRHYIGSTENLQRRIREHKNGGTHTTRRLGSELILVASKEFASIDEARRIERKLKRKKNPQLAIHELSCNEQPRMLSGLVVGSSPTQPKSNDLFKN